MRLSEFYSEENFYYSIDGILFPRYSQKTENGELYIDEERNLYYRDNASASSVLLNTDVGEWIYFNDKKIICSASDLDNIGDAIYICITDICGNPIASGTLTLFGLVYKRDSLIIKEDSNQKENIIFELNNPQTPVMYWDDSFSIPFFYPHSDFLYNKFYDYDGNYLEEKTKRTFIQMFLRELIYSFVSCPIAPSGLTSQQKKTLDALEKIRFGATKVTFDIVDQIIEILECGNISDKYAVRGYQKLKKVFISHGVNDNLVKPFLNVMIVNRSGEFGRRSSKWISLVNAQRIATIAKNNKESFKNIVADIALLRENMHAISK